MMKGETESYPLYIIMCSLKNTVRYFWNVVSDRTFLFYSYFFLFPVVCDGCYVALFLLV